MSAAKKWKPDIKLASKVIPGLRNKIAIQAKQRRLVSAIKMIELPESKLARTVSLMSKSDRKDMVNAISDMNKLKSFLENEL